MCIGHGHLPDGYVGCYAGQELSNSQGDDESHVVPSRDVRSRSHSPELEEGSAINCYRQQLDHRDGGWERKLIEHHLPDDIVRTRDDIPDQAKDYNGESLPSLLPHPGPLVLLVHSISQLDPVAG